jgi:drug/metabolite transporter (DMT)-like permease
MTFLSAPLHILNLILPAVFVGGLLAVIAPLVLRIQTKRTRQQMMRQWLINAIVGIATLAFGLWFYGVDGKMMSYTALVVAQALSQFVQLRAWRK